MPKRKRSANGTDRARETFLEVLRDRCNVSEACRAANIPRRTAYNWRAEDGEFAEAWADAADEAADVLEGVAWDRATNGQSDRMLELLLKAHRPEKYKDRVVNELSGPGGGPIPVRTLSDFYGGLDAEGAGDGG